MIRAIPVAALAAALVLGCRSPSMRSPAPESTAPSTDIYLYRFARFPLGSAVFNITNRRGYDNQPFWHGNGRLLYTSQSAGQYDIYEVNFDSGVIARFTDTPESEYSPALTPDGQAITVVRVERDSAQRLWRFPLNRAAPSLVLADIRPVGYFAWLDTTRLALFVLGNPATLQIADIRSGTAQVAARDIGRSLQRVPGGSRASYLHRVGSRWLLETVDPTPRADGGFDIDTVAVMPDSAEYVVWRSSTELYTAAGSRIYRMRLPDPTWVVVEDLAERGIRRISRLAIAPDGSRLALVADDGEPRP
jgi:hypothetical protein